MKKVSKEPLISVIIPVYNVEKYLNRCVDSVINQTYKNLEIILVDDGSPDNCPKICDDYAKKDKRIKVIHKKNGGLSDARNVGINKSNGDYITFIDSDDYVEDNYVSFLYNLIIEYKAEISMGKHYICRGNKIVNTGTGTLYLYGKEDIFENMLYQNDFDVSAWAKLYKKTLFKTIKFPINRLFEDSATTYKLIELSSKTVLHSIPIYHYMIREDSITNSNFNRKKMDLIISTTEMTNFIVNKYPELKDACDRKKMQSYLSTLRQLAESKKYDKKTKDELMDYINKNRKNVLNNHKISSMDRFALYSTIFGFSTFKFIYNIYKKIR